MRRFLSKYGQNIQKERKNERHKYQDIKKRSMQMQESNIFWYYFMHLKNISK